MSNATPAVITAALGLLVGYDSALAVTAPSAPATQHERSQNIQRLADEIHAVVADANSMEETFSRLIRNSAKSDLRDQFMAEGIQPLTDLLINLRGVEVGLKGAAVPEELDELHLNMRRAIAKGRARVATFHSMASQAFSLPKVVDGKAGGTGLQVLAEHSTKRLIEMASA
tara:strand:+ start:408 stop:920 length:513 start_codon:yes stop_codon:yes gene_type:complete